LEHQAETFALNFSSHGYINFFKTMRIQRQNVEAALKELYVYNYTKSIWNALYFHTISEQSEMGLFFDGNAAFFHLLKQGSNASSFKDVHISYSIDLGTMQQKKSLFVLLFAKFPFLREYSKFSRDSFGTKPFFIPKYESYMNYLTEDYYSRDHVQQGEQENPNTAHRAMSNYPNGKLKIQRVNGNDTSSITSWTNTPMLNAFLNSSGNKFHFIMPNADKVMENNSSVFFTKACHLALSSKGNDQKKINDIYSENPVNEQMSHVICSEVFTITGIKCRFIPAKPNKGKFKAPGSNKLDNLLDQVSKAKNIKEDILEIIASASGIIEDVEEFFNQLLNKEEVK
jgi:hypothetical protein